MEYDEKESREGDTGRMEQRGVMKKGGSYREQRGVMEKEECHGEQRRQKIKKS